MPKRKTVAVKSSPRSPIAKKYIVVGIVVVVLALVYVYRGLFIAATVNSRPIGRLDVIKLLEKQGGKTTLDTLVTKELILQDAQKRKVNVSQTDIDAEIKKIEASLTAQGQTLDTALQSQGMSKNDLVDEIRLQLIVQKIVGKTVTVTDKEVDDYINSQQSLTVSPTGEPSRATIKQQIEQQKLQQKVQEYISGLKSKAKINYFVNY